MITKLKNKVDTKKELWIFSCLIIVLNIGFGQAFYKNIVWLVLAFLISFFSYQLNFMVYILGVTGFLGLQMNGTNNFSEVAVIALALRLIIEEKGKIKVIISEKEKKMFLLTGIAICLLSMNIIVSYVRWGQPLINSIIVNRRLIELLGLPLYCQLVRCQKIDFQEFEETMSSLCTLFSVILIVQFFLRNNIQFIPVCYATRTGVELDRILMHNFASFLCLFAGIQFYKLLERITIIRVFRIGIYTFVLAGVFKGRAITIALACIYLFVLFWFGEGKKRRRKNIILFLLGLLAVLLFTGIFFDFLKETVFRDVFSSEKEFGRIREIRAYFETIPEYTFLGSGVYSAKYENEILANIVSSKLFISDIGILGEIYSYGISAIIVFMMGVISTLRIFLHSDIKLTKLSAVVTLITMGAIMWTVPSLSCISLIVVTHMMNTQNILDRELCGKEETLNEMHEEKP